MNKKEIVKTFSEDKQCTGSDPNMALPEYNSAVLPTHQCAYSFTDTPVCSFIRKSSDYTLAYFSVRGIRKPRDVSI
jgi:hypothetical protein